MKLLENFQENILGPISRLIEEINFYFCECRVMRGVKKQAEKLKSREMKDDKGGSRRIKEDEGG